MEHEFSHWAFKQEQVASEIKVWPILYLVAVNQAVEADQQSLSHFFQDYLKLLGLLFDRGCIVGTSNQSFIYDFFELPDFFLVGKEFKAFILRTEQSLVDGLLLFNLAVLARLVVSDDLIERVENF